MALSSDIISQFAKITNDKTETKKETIAYGTTVVYNGTTYVKLDGSDRLTPVSTTTDTKDGERVTVMIKNHEATITGNISSPSARTEDVKKSASQITELEIVTAYRITTEELNTVTGYIDNLKAIIGRFENVSTEDLEAINADIESLDAKFINATYITAEDVRTTTATIESLKGKLATFTDVSTEDLEAANAEIGQLEAYNANFTYVFADELSAVNAKINNLEVNKLSATDAELKYANIDFTNIDKAAIEYFYAQSGLIKDVTVGDQTITGTLAGVTIKGDLIEGGTVVADKLVLRGEDGLYYKLNMSDSEPVYKTTTTYGEPIFYVPRTIQSHYKVEYDSELDIYLTTDELVDIVEGSLIDDIYTNTNDQVYAGTTADDTEIYYTSIEETHKYKAVYDSDLDTYTVTDEELDLPDGSIIESGRTTFEQTEYNSIDGRVIIAKSITATKIDVNDLVAFDATIGGFEITEDSIHSFGKDSIKNSTNGIYMGNDGQVYFGDATNFIKYYKSDVAYTMYMVVEYQYDENTGTETFVTTSEHMPESFDKDAVLPTGLYTTTGEEVYTWGDVFFCKIDQYNYVLDISAKSIRFGVDNSSLEEEINDTKNAKDNLDKHFEFNENGITIKLGESSMKLRLDNDMISFYKGEIDEFDLTKNRFGWWDGVDFHTGNIVVNVEERAQFGDFAFVPRSDGSLSFLKVAGGAE